MKGLPSSRDDEHTTDFLARWQEAGDESALHELIRRNAPWILDHVRRRLGDGLREKLQSVDVVQEAMVEVLRYAPPFVTTDESGFRNLMARIVENVLRDQHKFFHARRRAMSRERSPNSALPIAADSAHSPTRVARRTEESQWIRLALELLSPEDRELLVLRQWDGLTFPEIAERLGIQDIAARGRFRRAVGRLAREVARLKGSRAAGDVSS